MNFFRSFIYVNRWYFKSISSPRLLHDQIVGRSKLRQCLAACFTGGFGWRKLRIKRSKFLFKILLYITREFVLSEFLLLIAREGIRLARLGKLDAISRKLSEALFFKYLKSQSQTKKHPIVMIKLKTNRNRLSLKLFEKWWNNCALNLKVSCWFT